MGKGFNGIDPRLATFLTAQPVCFVAGAPNCSSHDAFLSQGSEDRRKPLQLVDSKSCWKEGRLAVQLHPSFDLILGEAAKARAADAADLAGGVGRSLFETGRGGGIRTLGPLLPKQVRCRAALLPVTEDLLCNSHRPGRRSAPVAANGLLEGGESKFE